MRNYETYLSGRGGRRHLLHPGGMVNAQPGSACLKGAEELDAVGSWNSGSWFWEDSLSKCGNLSYKPADSFGTLLNQGTAWVAALRFLLTRDACWLAATFRLCLAVRLAEN